MNDKVLGLLGFASKSGNLSFGMDSTKESLAKAKTKLILVAADISPKSLKEITFFADKHGKEVISVEYSSDTLASATGRKGGILSVNDEGFAKAIRGGIVSG
ncbi:MAG: ribosomal L7Ae/L30e/S12e/Gadd45 family protein [Oscillospiraceae bacterium]|nr:ribosomal L7Ae/L30e/S12e/Gadd45 family protein [Oscillospiraceae bacterium]